MTLDLTSLLALAAAMTLLAATPSISVLAVTSRAAAFGLTHGAAVSLGIVLGDLLFILIALLGMALLAERLEPAFALLQIAGAAYLLWLGFRLLRPSPAPTARAAHTVTPPRSESLVASALSGLLLTLADQKALLFYLGFLPAFVDLARLTLADVLAILLTTLLTVGGIKLLYAALAARLGSQVPLRAPATLRRLAGVAMLLVALVVGARAGSLQF